YCGSTKGRTGSNAGLRFGSDPLFLASSVFVKKVERVMATGFVMVLCLLVYRLAEHRPRQRLAETGETVPDQRKQADTADHPALSCFNASRGSAWSCCSVKSGWKQSR